MRLYSLLYISRSTIAPSDAKEVVDQIIDTALDFNPSVGLTGALLFTGTYFAQVLEGDVAAIDELVEHISRDPRHDQMRIVDRSPLSKRRFADWSMAYFGPSNFVSRHVTRLLGDTSPAEQSRSAEWLTELMHEFSQGASAQL
ncbi:BLUF domain-containing protein [Parasphingorhabdus sp.]|uniref:BLUF domain-containing protein n=1 Tax=Parasphingorhabdus sp. TaxID=2709688 RepID=UPI003593323F